ncbi:unnamed protein product [Rotaria sordida]|uniref:RRM domain-containing protein n=1 Tax=Rotaria sordida TaxID=392033 RepID=A0A814C8F9_9BILA|nr:unnamed protein product [Rotaria sordida]CAF1316458.1 unnamed protein product [Rotaria sordida]
MSSSYNMNNFILRLRDLPWNTSQNAVQNFLHGCKICQIQFVTNDQDASTGECFVIVETKDDIDLAKSFDKKMMGNRAISTSFTMRMRGVPFDAGEKEIFDFFSPVVSIRLEQENTPRGKPLIWYAEFGSRKEATEAMT